MAERIVRVDIRRKISNRQLLDALAREAGNWTPKAMDSIARSNRVPEDTGRLLSDTDTRVFTQGGNVVCRFLWKAPYATLADEMEKHGKAPVLPGRISPYGVPMVKVQADSPSFRAMLKKALGDR